MKAKTIEEYIVRHSSHQPEKVALVCGETTVTYSQLLHQIEAQADTLQRQGLQPRHVLPIVTTQSIDFLVTYFAAHKVGAVCLPLPPSTSEEELREATLSYSSLTLPEGTADILLTTGTTGYSKRVVISHSTIVADAENLISSQGFCSSTTFVINGPLNHIGSLSKVYPTIYMGGTIIILPGMKDFAAFFQALDYSPDHVATFLVPSSIHMLLQFAKSQLQSRSRQIDFIETGAAPLSQTDMTTLCETLPFTRLYNTYASTETGIITTHNYNEGTAVAGCLGKPMQHSKVTISPEGKIICSGATLMTGYLTSEGLKTDMIINGTYTTNDNGYIDEEGRLHIKGRIDDIINVGGYKVSPQEVEEAASTLPEVEDCICIPYRHPILGNALKLLVQLTEGATLDKPRIARYLSTRLERHKVPLAYEAVNTIARTFNGKLNRKYYLTDQD